jgi:hypothetical protein
MGHNYKLRSSIGRVNAIMILPDGQKEGEQTKEEIIQSCGY